MIAGISFYLTYLFISASVDNLSHLLGHSLAYPSFQILSFRYILSFLLILPFLLGSKRILWSVVHMPDKIRQALKPSLMYLASLLSIVSLSVSTLSTFSLAQQVAPLVTVLMATIILKERFNIFQTIVLIIAFMGGVIEISEVEIPSLLGLTSLTLFVLSFASFMTISRFLIARSLSGLASICFFFLTAGILALITLPFTSHQLKENWHFFLFLLMAVLTIVQQLVLLQALQRIPLSRLAILGFFAPLITAFSGAIFYGEHLSTQFFIGSFILIFSGIAMFLSPFLKKHQNTAKKNIPQPNFTCPIYLLKEILMSFVSPRRLLFFGIFLVIMSTCASVVVDVCFRILKEVSSPYLFLYVFSLLGSLVWPFCIEASPIP